MVFPCRSNRRLPAEEKKEEKESKRKGGGRVLVLFPGAEQSEVDDSLYTIDSLNWSFCMLHGVNFWDDIVDK